MTTAAEAVEIAMRGATFTETEARRLRTVIAARTRPDAARDHLERHVAALDHVVSGPLGAEYLATLRRLIRETLAEQAQQAIAAAADARAEFDEDSDLGAAAAGVVLAVEQALLTDREG